MIQCAMSGEGCRYHFDMWFHFECVGISNDMQQGELDALEWFCPLCIEDYATLKYSLEKALAQSGYEDQEVYYELYDEYHPHNAIEDHKKRVKICRDTYWFDRRTYITYEKNMYNRMMAELNANTDVAKKRVREEAQQREIMKQKERHPSTGQLRLPPPTTLELPQRMSPKGFRAPEARMI